MAFIEKFGPLMGRILLALMFVPSGFSKIGNFEGTAAYIASKGLPLPPALAAGTIALEIVGGLALLLGFKARWAALVLAVFAFVAALVFHNFWAVDEAQKMAQNISFYKNLAITGGLLFVAAFGAGPVSLDQRESP
ncbi:DoxX family protein [Aquabacterium sp. A7-Y]|uniref:DoxX family protein n=1 Tax=Aquabacterium sp. A7-Y TaxID=1349605 RepID=UPI00223D9477|nr:DoxX family protein [Aquabacterium sp. A7-Y]MCW7536599.1 DoxX family protein [Aquabacterium sp. A7-Y]